MLLSLLAVPTWLLGTQRGRAAKGQLEAKNAFKINIRSSKKVVWRLY